MIALINNAQGIGDKIQFSSLPEIIFHNTNKKVIDYNNCWVFDHNPHVIRGNHDYDKIINPWDISHSYKADYYLSISERFFKNSEFSDFKITLRHPRLYKFEDIKIIPNRVVIHTTGKSEGGQINDEVLHHIKNTYSNFDIIQIGGLDDKPTEFINKLGLSLWETAEIIASSSIFIGVNSGMMNIANCYPRINRKIILNRDDLDTISPLNPNTGWLDYNVQYFNQTQFDIGTTYSFLKL